MIFKQESWLRVEISGLNWSGLVRLFLGAKMISVLTRSVGVYRCRFRYDTVLVSVELFSGARYYGTVWYYSGTYLA